MFPALLCPSSGARQTAVAASGFRPARPQPTALLSPSSDGKPEAATAAVVAPDDGHEDARNMLSCLGFVVPCIFNHSNKTPN